MPATYEPIATTTLGSAASTITFSSIPNTFTDLRLVVVPQRNNAGSLVYRVNGSVSGYSQTFIVGNGTSATSGRSADESYWRGNDSNMYINSFETLDIFSYAGSTNKTMLATSSTDNNGSGQVTYSVGLWRNTGAITSIAIIRTVESFQTGTTATLYGIKAA